MIKSAKDALATYFGWDIADMKDAEYQHGLYTKAVYESGEDYYCASKNPKQLPKPVTENRGIDFVWEEVKDDHVNSFGWKIFKHNENLKEEIFQGNEKTANFLKDAFCISGESKYDGVVKVKGMTSLMFELNDDKRGKFYVTISK